MRKYQHLLTPLSYLRLRSADLSFFQWVLPIIIASIGIAGFYALPLQPPLLSDKGLINTVNGLLNTLVGFYIAALAAIAAFPNKVLDETMKGSTPVLTIYRQGRVTEEKLTRRRFLVILFGYCAFLSIMLFALGVVSAMIAPSVVKVPRVETLRFVWICAYFLMASSLFVATMLGLHYLIDRMHRE